MHTFTMPEPSFAAALNLNPSLKDRRMCFGGGMEKYEVGDDIPVNAGLFISIVSSQCPPNWPKGHEHAYPETVLIHRPPFTPQIPGEQASPTCSNFDMLY